MPPAANRPEVACPHCGAPLPIRSPAAVLVICEYCQTAVYWDADAIHAAGQQAALTEGFTRLYRGATGAIEGEALEVLGRIRYRSDRGFWDEWFVRIGDETAWLTEDDHELALQSPRDPDALGDVLGLGPGDRFELPEGTFEVDEVGEAETVGVEGQLPQKILTGERYRFLDASSLDGRHALGVELDDDPPTAFLGRWLDHGAVSLDDEGEDW